MLANRMPCCNWTISNCYFTFDFITKYHSLSALASQEIHQFVSAIGSIERIARRH